MKFNKTYNEYMQQFVAEGLLGSIAAAIPRTIGKAVGNVVKQAYGDNPWVQAYGQVRQQQSGEREAQRSKEGEIFAKVEEDLQNDPNFISKKITFVYSLSTGSPITESKSYADLTQYRTRRDTDKINAISKVISEVDLNNTSFNLYNGTVQKSLKEKISEVILKENKEKKQDMGEDFKKVKAEIPNIINKIERMLKDTLQPLGANKGLGKKITWLFILANMSGSTPTIKL
jgi:hypothetical protein